MNATTATAKTNCSKCGKNFRSVKHAPHRAGSHEFVAPTAREEKVLWKSVEIETERGTREGRIVAVEDNPRSGDDFCVQVEIKRMGTAWRWLSELKIVA